MFVGKARIIGASWIPKMENSQRFLPPNQTADQFIQKMLWISCSRNHHKLGTSAVIYFCAESICIKKNLPENDEHRKDLYIFIKIYL